MDLFKRNGEAYARSADPETSQEAAAAMRGEAATRVECLVLEALIRIGGLGTAYQIEVEVQRLHPTIHGNTITPRLKPLERKNLVERTDRRGPGRGSHSQIAWRSI